MARVPDLLNTLGVAADGITTDYPDTFVDDMGLAYGEDTAAYEAKISVLTADLAEAQQKILALQAHNYELMVASAPVSGVEDAGEDDGDGEDADSTDENSGVDSLFGPEEKDEN